ncbi:hypothetical protein QWY84_01615 [Aquisalimonas lutea]|uniref:hypothetical protein n=1 Tax=Aquisalimonas lutea TaxID=1327750 RepID=UPI0025B2F33F|nr:hypothetical protein [Aquisalimonas lutea]MDN3516298.1 hypothetical protein [Aquisalimonas lutea]
MSTSCDLHRGTGIACVPSGWRYLAGGVLALAAGAVGAETSYGPALTLGEGSARVYLVTEGDAPVELGLALDDAFLAALPPDGAPHGMVMPDGHSTFEYVLAMPENNPTPFRHLTLDWNPAGHVPEGVWNVPHLDVHFYVISNDERLAIHPSDPAFADKGQRLPDAAFVPAGYVDPGIPPVPLMGLHLVDPDSPELHPDTPQPFTHTFLYGSWDGRLIFLEPMVTTAYLQGREDAVRRLPVAERYEPAGYYPDGYRVHWDEATGEHRVALTGLAMR